MTVIEKINEINDSIKEILVFTQANDTIREDFNEYLSTIGARELTSAQMEKIFLPYIIKIFFGAVFYNKGPFFVIKIF